MTSTEFVEWKVFLDEQVNAFHREDYFLAAIIAEVRRSYVKYPKRVKLQHHLLKFTVPGRSERTKTVGDKSGIASKQFWFAATGYNQC